MKENYNTAPADGLLGDMTVTLDVPIGTVVSLVIGATVVFCAYFLCRKYILK
jgi:hypothetical protein